MDRQAQRAFAVGTGVQLAWMLAIAVLVGDPHFEALLSLAGVVGGGSTAVALVRDGAPRSWEDAAFYGGGAAAVATVAYFAVESSVTTVWIWHTRGVFAPVNVFLVRYLFGIWLVIIGIVVGVTAAVVGFRVATAVTHRVRARRSI